MATTTEKIQALIDDYDRQMAELKIRRDECAKMLGMLQRTSSSSKAKAAADSPDAPKTRRLGPHRAAVRVTDEIAHVSIDFPTMTIAESFVGLKTRSLSAMTNKTGRARTRNGFVMERIDSPDPSRSLESICSELEFPTSQEGVVTNDPVYSAAETGRAPYEVLREALATA